MSERDWKAAAIAAFQQVEDASARDAAAAREAERVERARVFTTDLAKLLGFEVTATEARATIDGVTFVAVGGQRGHHVAALVPPCPRCGAERVRSVHDLYDLGAYLSGAWTADYHECHPQRDEVSPAGEPVATPADQLRDVLRSFLGIDALESRVGDQENAVSSAAYDAEEAAARASERAERMARELERKQRDLANEVDELERKQKAAARGARGSSW